MTKMREALQAAGITTAEEQAIEIACECVRRSDGDHKLARQFLDNRMSQRDGVLWHLLRPYWTEVSRALLARAAKAVKAEGRKGGEASSALSKDHLLDASPPSIGGHGTSARKGHLGLVAEPDGTGLDVPARESQTVDARPSGPSHSLVGAMKQARAAEVRSVLDQVCPGVGKPYRYCVPEDIRPLIKGDLRHAYYLSNLINGVPDGKPLGEFYEDKEADALHRKCFGTNLHLQVMENRDGA